MSPPLAAGVSLPPEAVIWDLDGTLIDQTVAIIRCYRAVIEAFGYPQPEEHDLRRSFGMPMAGTMALFIAEADLTAACNFFREIFPQRMMDGLEILPGAERLLAEAAGMGIPQAIFTNKHGPTARALMDSLGWQKWLQACIGNGDTQWSKPEVDYTRHVLTTLGVEPSARVLVIGDSPTDVAVAQPLGLSVVGVATGSYSVDELVAAGASAAIPNLSKFSFGQ
jgi:phosphoglycolate phosphatase